MSLEASVVLHLGSLDLDVTLSAPSGAVLAVLGPNGSGKTTLLRALAGLVELERGRVELDGALWDDPSSGVRMAPEERRVGYVFQDYLLFPHLSVADNVAFGLRARGAGKVSARKAALDWLERFGLAKYASSRPSQLSGGQAQRVALARALATDPRLLLLDEPLAALDAGTKLEVRRELSRHLSSFEGTTILVTHNPLEAAALASRLVVLEGGRVVQRGGFADIARQPRSSYVAELVGLNLIRGMASGRSLEVNGHGKLALPSEAAGEVFAAIHPRAVALHRSQPEGSPRNVWKGRISSIDLEGDRVRVSVEGPAPIVSEVTAQSAAEMKLAEADEVWLSIKATEIQVYPV